MPDLRLLVPAETRPGESRIAVVPSVVSKFQQLGFDVQVEAGAGAAAYATDEDFRAAGATVLAAEHIHDALGDADVVATVRPLAYTQASRLSSKALAISFLG